MQPPLTEHGMEPLTHAVAWDDTNKRIGLRHFSAKRDQAKERVVKEDGAVPFNPGDQVVKQVDKGALNISRCRDCG